MFNLHQYFSCFSDYYKAVFLFVNIY
jgi:hypothetical protein